MGYILRLPCINAPTEAEKIEQLRTYLYQTVKDIEWSLNALDTASADTLEAREVDANSTFSMIKPMIVKSSDIINAYYNIMKDRFDDVYVKRAYTYVEGNIQEYALMCNEGVTSIATNESTQGLPTGYQKSVGTIHRISDDVVIQLTDMTTGHIATNSFINNAWIGWKSFVPE